MNLIKFIKEQNHKRLKKRHEKHAAEAVARQLAKYREAIPEKVKAIQNKDKIKVLFVLYESATWKTEALYLAMQNHTRFDVQIGITLSLAYAPSKSISSLTELTQYLDSKGYAYMELSKGIINNILQPDIIFYQTPYSGVIDNDLYIDSIEKDTLFCHIQYAFNTRYDRWAVNQPLHLKAWQVYYENESAADAAKAKSLILGSNYRVTGLPIQDELMTPKEIYSDPWKKQDKKKKRIIWAPHHSINKDNWIVYSTFLEYADNMLSLARKYREEVQFVFKPHPVLAGKLDRLWGKEKRIQYYSEWAKMDNGQLSTGKYIDVFKYSDAMIHDCSSFMIEYHYTQNPVMYLTSSHTSQEGLMAWAEEAFNLHYKGQSIADIEKFIQNVIAGTDPMKEKRKEYYYKYLTPPNGKTACENIINDLLS